VSLAVDLEHGATAANGATRSGAAAGARGGRFSEAVLPVTIGSPRGSGWCDNPTPSPPAPPQQSGNQAFLVGTRMPFQGNDSALDETSIRPWVLDLSEGGGDGGAGSHASSHSAGHGSHSASGSGSASASGGGGGSGSMSAGSRMSEIREVVYDATSAIGAVLDMPGGGAMSISSGKTAETLMMQATVDDALQGQRRLARRTKLRQQQHSSPPAFLRRGTSAGTGRMFLPLPPSLSPSQTAGGGAGGIAGAYHSAGANADDSIEGSPVDDTRVSLYTGPLTTPQTAAQRRDGATALLSRHASSRSSSPSSLASQSPERGSVAGEHAVHVAATRDLRPFEDLLPQPLWGTDAPHGDADDADDAAAASGTRSGTAGPHFGAAADARPASPNDAQVLEDADAAPNSIVGVLAKRSKRRVVAGRRPSSSKASAQTQPGAASGRGRAARRESDVTVESSVAPSASPSPSPTASAYMSEATHSGAAAADASRPKKRVTFSKYAEHVYEDARVELKRVKGFKRRRVKSDPGRASATGEGPTRRRKAASPAPSRSTSAASRMDLLPDSAYDLVMGQYAAAVAGSGAAARSHSSDGESTPRRRTRVTVSRRSGSGTKRRPVPPQAPPAEELSPQAEPHVYRARPSSRAGTSAAPPAGSSNGSGVVFPGATYRRAGAAPPATNRRDTELEQDTLGWYRNGSGGASGFAGTSAASAELWRAHDGADAAMPRGASKSPVRSWSAHNTRAGADASMQAAAGAMHMQRYGGSSFAGEQRDELPEEDVNPGPARVYRAPFRRAGAADSFAKESAAPRGHAPRFSVPLS
jgi:hypothetical protein